MSPVVGRGERPPTLASASHSGGSSHTIYPKGGWQVRQGRAAGHCTAHSTRTMRATTGEGHSRTSGLPAASPTSPSSAHRHPRHATALHLDTRHSCLLANDVTATRRSGQPHSTAQDILTYRDARARVTVSLDRHTRSARAPLSRPPFCCQGCTTARRGILGSRGAA